MIKPCFHCGLTIPAHNAPHKLLLDAERFFCCNGCKAVAETIVQQGLGDYYAQRQQPAPTQSNLPPEIQNLSDLDHPAFMAEFVHSNSEQYQAELSISGMTCTACSWLIERRLSAIPGIYQASINFSTQRLLLHYAPEVSLAQVVHEIARLGYFAKPFIEREYEAQLKKTAQKDFRRLAVAGLGAMQAMMFAIGLYLGAAQDMSLANRNFLRWITFLVSTPVVFYAGWPFYTQGLRALRFGQITMDLSLSLAILLVYGGSVIALLTHRGDTYFDSISMLIFFVTVSRFLEVRARHSAGTLYANLDALSPTLAWKSDQGQLTRIASQQLHRGDQVLVKPGERIPCDGTVDSGCSTVNESLLTGEAKPVAKFPGSTVIAGSLNQDQPMEIHVTAVGTQTTLASFERLLKQAIHTKPPSAQLADKIASWFISGVFLLSLTTFLYFDLAAKIGFETAMWRAISVLIVTCPCALALAIPAVWTVVTHRLAALGFLIANPSALEKMPDIDTILVDKTGTLTTGSFSLHRIVPLNMEQEQALSIACSLEFLSEHPVAQVFLSIKSERQPVEHWLRHPEGISGTIAGIRYRLGRSKFVDPNVSETPDDDPSIHWLALGCEDGPILAWFALTDQIRPDAKTWISTIQRQNIEINLVSGDRCIVVENVALQLNIHHWYANQSPADKLNILQQLQQQGKKVLVIGDGMNDAPILAAADLSIAMAAGAQLAQCSADAVLLDNHLLTINQAITMAHKMRTIILQNLSWALLYNLCMVPLAAFGYIPPWLAALGMSFSSIIVVGNALRLKSTRLVQHP